MVKSNNNWEAENDAYTMAKYQEIIQDKARMNRAIKAAQKQAADLNKREAAMNAVSKKKTK